MRLPWFSARLQGRSNSAAVGYYAAAAGVEPPPAFSDVLRLADSGDAHAIAALERMAHFLGVGLAGLVTGLAPDMVVIIGDVTAAWHRVGPIVSDVVKQYSLPHASIRILPTDPASQPRLRGAVTLVVQLHFGAPNVA